MRNRDELVPLDWQTMPLQGRVLIEASAGTGKTHNIGLVWLRLLLERGLGVQQILVTTFTEAAAQELRERLRRRLVEVEHWFLTGKLVGRSDDKKLLAYLQQRANDQQTRTMALRRIQLARADFDRAPIATIHSLCMRIQRDFPLDTGASFQIGTATDERTLLRECLEDFWRQRFLGPGVDEREAAAVLAGGIEPLLRDIEDLFGGNPRLIAPDGLAEIERLVLELRTPQSIKELGRLVADDSLYARKKSALQARLREIGTALMFNGDLAVFLKGDKGACFDADGIGNQWSAAGAKVLAEHWLIVLLRELRGLLPHADRLARGSVVTAAHAFCREQIPLRARRRDAQTFSMLIDEVHERIVGDGGKLAKRLAEAFPAALVDEFQDTDTRQFEIFDRIFRHSAEVTRGLMVMIGDPKQAIFGFRGGDIAAYLRASTVVEERFALLDNHRSSRTLVAALNALYGKDGGGFGDTGIHFRPVSAAGEADAKPYTVAGEPVTTAVHIHHFSEPLPTGDMERRALEDCANRIAELLNDATRSIGGKRVGPGDIAVLVPKNAQIGQLRELFATRQIPCVGSGRDSVLQSDTARDLRAILFALLNAEDDRAVRGALTTNLLGATYADLLAWQHDLAGFERQLEQFANWRDLARARGVPALIDALVELHGAQWLARANGERIVTDLRHLGELLADVAGERHGLEGLYAWLGEMADDGGSIDLRTSDARQPRIESDAQRVQLMTMHNAKGLEFPIVFLPMAWRSFGLPNPRVVKFHDVQGRECADPGSMQFADHRTRHFLEDLEERQRLQYVALTRAAHALHVYWAERSPGRVDDPARQTVPLDLLLHAAQRALGVEPGAASLHTLDSLPGVAVVGAYEDAPQKYRAAELADSPRAARVPLPQLRPFRWLHSFSSLTRKVQALEHETIAADEIEASQGPEAITTDDDQPDDARLLALQFQRGPRFGDAVHKILENAAAGSVWPAQRDLLVRTLQAAGARAGNADDAGALEAVGRLVDRVRDCDLGDRLRLGKLDAAARVAEFEFQFPLRRVSVPQLRAVCAAHGHADVVPAQLAFNALDGMLTGFIDLVFAHGGRYHVLDYKTNWLGARLADYQGAALNDAMRAHHYELQALLYTVAVHRYLGGRLDGYTPEQHLGDSWYLFLRALGLGPGLGVWRRRWPIGLIRALDDAFAGEVAVA